MGTVEEFIRKCEASNRPIRLAVSAVPMKTRRNIYAEQLADYADVALGGDRVFELREKWREHFADRIGSTFSGQIVFEVGCADAPTLCDIAAKFPHVAFVGLDWKFKSIYVGAQLAREMGLRNVMLLRGRAQDLSRIFADGELDEAWVFHPEPCDRPEELPNRLLNEPFLMQLHRALRSPGSAVCIKTDHPGYYQWLLGLLGQPEPAWFQSAREQWLIKRKVEGLPRVKAREIVSTSEVPAQNDAIRQHFDVAITSADFWSDPLAQSATADKLFTGFVTGFEQRFRSKRLPIYYVELKKK